jgi:hypothetical protein
MLGSSSNKFDNTIKKILSITDVKNILELGCGRGKFADLLTDLTNTPELRAVQKIFTADDDDYLKAKGYKEIIDADILDYFKNGFDQKYDMIVALDVIEHFLYSDVISIINFALYRSDYLLLVWPSAHPQDGEISSFDRHRASFELRDLSDKFSVIFYSQSGFAEINCLHRYHIALLRGHMNLKVLPFFD